MTGIDSLAALRLLAAIRLANGALGLFAPHVLVRRLGADPREEPAALYPFRMFGVRTILVGSDLLLLRGTELKRSVGAAVIIHGCDTASAALGGARGEVSRRTAVLTTLISATNTALAVTAWRGKAWERQAGGGAHR
jgi:hypothetical protein